MRTDKIINTIRYLLAVPRSFYINFRLLPFLQAIQLPIIVSNKTILRSLSGKIYLKKIKTGIVRIGFGGTDMLDYKYNRTILKITGNIYFHGKTKIGVGAKIDVQGTLEIGENFAISGDAMIICSKNISIGANTMIAWQSIVMDTDQHDIFNQNHIKINESEKISIGKHVWIGARSFILKGVHIPDGSIVGANTTITKSFSEKNIIIAGHPNKIIKSNILWGH